MSDTDHLTKNGRRNFSVPTWAVELAKLAATGLFALLAVYVRFANVEDTGKETKVKHDALEVVVNSLERRQGITETKAEGRDREIQNSLIRLESGMKELQSDVKAMQMSRNLAPK